MDEERKKLMEEMREYNRLYKSFDEIYHTIALRLGMSDSMFDILYAVYVLGEGCRQKDITMYACSRKSTIHSAIHKLERDGILRLDHGRARETLVFLTPAGRKLVDEKIAQVVDIEERALRDTDWYTRFVMRGVMDRFAENLRREAEAEGLQ